MSINQRIRERRAALGLTLMQLAEASGVKAWQTVQAWERNSAPSRRRLEKVAEVLQVTPEWLVTGRGPQESTLLQAFTDLSGVESQLVMLYRLLDDNQKNSLIKTAYGMASQNFDQLGGAPLTPIAEQIKSPLSTKKVA